MKGSVRKRGKKWYYYFTHEGKRIERVAGDTRKEALEELRKVLVEIDKTGVHIDDKGVKFKDYLDIWFEEYVLLNCRKNTQTAYKNLINNHLVPGIGNLTLRELTPAVIQKFINEKYINGFAKSYLSNILGLISGSLKYAVHPMQLIRTNPCQYVSLPKKAVNRKRAKALSESDISKILKSFPDTSNMHTVIMIAIYTGMRGGEICALTWDDIDLEEGIISVKGTLHQDPNTKRWQVGPPKTKASYREISIGKTLIDCLKAKRLRQKESKLRYGKYYKNSKYVNTKEDGQLVTTNSIKYISRVVNYNLGIDFNFHLFRHTHATMLLESGVNIKYIQYRLGHSKIATTLDTYSHVTNNMEGEAVDILESKFATK